MIAEQPVWPRSGKSCFEFRIGIEGEAAAAAARNRTAADIISLGDVLKQLEVVQRTGRSGLHEDFAFHLCVSRSSHNEYFTSALLSLRDDIFEGMLFARTSSGINTAEKIASINEQHRQVYEAILAGDEDAARGAMRSHLSRCKRSTSHWYRFEMAVR